MAAGEKRALDLNALLQEVAGVLSAATPVVHPPAGTPFPFQVRAEELLKYGALWETWGTRDIKLLLHLDPEAPFVAADRQQLQQVLSILLCNAAEASNAAGAVVALSTKQVTVTPTSSHRRCVGDVKLEPGSYIELACYDNGQGMDEATLSRIFEPFFSTRATGRGVGLPALLGIVRHHGGGVQVFSEPRKGATFRIFLPALSPRQQRRRRQLVAEPRRRA